MDMKKVKQYKVIALSNLNAEYNTWTKGLEYEVTETNTKFQITSNEAQIAYVATLKDAIMINFKLS